MITSLRTVCDNKHLLEERMQTGKLKEEGNRNDFRGEKADVRYTAEITE